MKQFILPILFGLLVTTSTASYWAGSPSTILVNHGGFPTLIKGPESASKVFGPDGSVIKEYNNAGAILTNPIHGGIVSSSINPGLVAHPVPLVHRPWISHSWPVVKPWPLVNYYRPPLYKTGTVIDGPSGIIRTSGSAHGLIASSLF